MTNIFPNNDNFIIFTINSILSPQYVSTFYAMVTSYDSSSNLLETSGSNTIKLVSIPGILNVTITPLNSTTVG